MLKVVKEHIIKEMKEQNKDIALMVPQSVEDYIRFKYKCSKYLAKQITKDLTNDGTGNN
jgi:hypothetical protein